MNHKEVLLLKDIISSEKIRVRLDEFIKSLHSFSHPNDLYKLDRLTCYISSFSRKKIDFETLKKFYMKEGLDPNIIEGVIRRMEIGLDVLEVKKNKERY